MTTQNRNLSLAADARRAEALRSVSDRQAEIILAFGKSVQRASKQKGAK
jgi:hypothetical protein